MAASTTLESSVGYKLVNPLDRFTSYSTHFIILAARTTDTAKKFAATDALSLRQTLDAIDRTTTLGEAVQFPGSTSDAYLVVDTRRFSQFSIQSMKYEVLLNGLQNGTSHSNLATTIEMTLLDSVGISFINFVQELMDTKLQTNFDGMVFLIRTIFVGHNQDGSTETVQSITIPAHLFKMDINLDYSKGIYDLQFMPNMNFDVNTHNRWLNIGNATTYFSHGANNLGSMVRSFEANLNKVSSDYYKNLNPDVVSSTGTTTRTSRKFGRLVKYQISLPEGWSELTFAGSNVNEKIERDFKAEFEKTVEQNKSENIPSINSHMSMEWGLKITDVLDIMFKQVPEIQELANSDKIKRTDEIVKFYKHVIGITSTEDTVTVHVDVVTFNIPPAKPSDAKDAANISKNDEHYVTVQTDKGMKRLPKTFFELDYIFTGLNTDVLNFDMKIQDLQFLLAANVKVQEGEVISQMIQGQEPDNQKDKKPENEVVRARAFDPLLIPMITDSRGKALAQYVRTRNEQLDKKIARNSQEYAQNLSAFYAISPITAAVTIKGNPEIMAHFNVGTLLPHISTATTAGQKTDEQVYADPKAVEDYRTQFENEILKKGATREKDGSFTVNPLLGNSSYTDTPVFVNVVVKGPNVDHNTGAAIEGGDYTTRVLFDNYYVVFKVVNMIEQGVFTQQLELWSHNVFGVNKLTQEQLSPRKTV